MQRHHIGSGRRQVIPADWAAHHAPVAEGTMLDGTVALRDPEAFTDGGWDEDTQQTTRIPAGPYATVACRIQALTGEARVVVTAEDDETVADYLIAVPRAVSAVVEGHTATVAVVDDPALDGRLLHVVRVVRGTHRFERDLYCTLSD